jgi:hemin uptake protein HemP
MTPERNPPPEPELTRGKKPVNSPAVFESAELFGEASVVLIRHAGREYRLRRTRLGKLILTA